MVNGRTNATIPAAREVSTPLKVKQSEPREKCCSAKAEANSQRWGGMERSEARTLLPQGMIHIRLGTRSTELTNIARAESRRICMKEVTLYDILGVLAPGVVFTVGILTIYPDVAPIVTRKEFTIGNFGLVVLISYVAGNWSRRLDIALNGSGGS